MTVAEIIKQLNSHNITVALNGDKLTIEAPKGTVKPEWRAFLKKHKPEIVAHLRSEHSAVIRDPPTGNVNQPLSCFVCGELTDSKATDWRPTVCDGPVHHRCWHGYGLQLANTFRRLL